MRSTAPSRRRDLHFNLQTSGETDPITIADRSGLAFGEPFAVQPGSVGGTQVPNQPPALHRSHDGVSAGDGRKGTQLPADRRESSFAANVELAGDLHSTPRKHQRARRSLGHVDIVYRVGCGDGSSILPTLIVSLGGVVSRRRLDPAGIDHAQVGKCRAAADTEQLVRRVVLAAQTANLHARHDTPPMTTPLDRARSSSLSMSPGLGMPMNQTAP